jgi:endogenous inhibitor of DNA gyrase (YacG/DUF329 family)
MRIEYVTCPTCQRPAGLAAATGSFKSDNLPDTFEIECPHCGAKSLLQKCSIESIDMGRTNEIV